MMMMMIILNFADGIVSCRREGKVDEKQVFGKAVHVPGLLHFRIKSTGIVLARRMNCEGGGGGVQSRVSKYLEPF